MMQGRKKVQQSAMKILKFFKSHFFEFHAQQHRLLQLVEPFASLSTREPVVLSRAKKKTPLHCIQLETSRKTNQKSYSKFTGRDHWKTFNTSFAYRQQPCVAVGVQLCIALYTHTHTKKKTKRVLSVEQMPFQTATLQIILCFPLTIKVNFPERQICR